MSKHEGGRASDPFFSTRLNLQEIKDGSRRMTGDTLFTILQQMYEARKKRLDPYSEDPGEFTFPGSNGSVRIEHISGLMHAESKNPYNAYNVSFIGGNGEKRELATVKSKDYTKDRAAIGEMDMESGRPYAYWGAVVEGIVTNSEEVVGVLSRELLTALNSLHKPSRGQNRRSKWS